MSAVHSSCGTVRAGLLQIGYGENVTVKLPSLTALDVLVARSLAVR